MAQLGLFDGARLALVGGAKPARITLPWPARRSMLFLDFDGVISWDQRHPKDTVQERLRRDKIAILNTIIERTGCGVVVSSMWRYNPRTEEGFKVERLQAHLDEAGFRGEIIGITCHLETPHPIHGLAVRGLEIQAWLDENNIAPETEIAILDDWQPMGHLKHRLVQTNYDHGLTMADAERVVSLLAPR